MSATRAQSLPRLYLWNKVDTEERTSIQRTNSLYNPTAPVTVQEIHDAIANRDWTVGSSGRKYATVPADNDRAGELHSEPCGLPVKA